MTALTATFNKPLNLPWVAPLRALLPWAQSLMLAYIRFELVHAFFVSGMGKLRDWETTIFLFTEEFHVPLLSPQLAAISGTAGELGLSVLLALGLFGRFAAAGLFVVNIMAVISYPGLTEGGLAQHFYWGVMIATLIAFGPGKLALDAWLARWPLFRSLALDAR